MKKIVTVLLAGLIIVSLTACTPNKTEVVNTDDPNTTPTLSATETPTVTPTPTQTPEPKLAEVSELLDVTALGGAKIGTMHGGHQTRIVHTKHGTYTVYIESTNDDTRECTFVVTKILNDEVKILYRNNSPYDAAGINIFYDPKTDDVYVAAVPVIKKYPDGYTGKEIAWLALYTIDAETDEVTEHKSEQEFEIHQGNGYGYSMPIVDIENRKIYAIYSSGGTLQGYFAWFTFDMETKTWQEGCVTVPIDVRYGYFYCYADGKGGAYFVGERNMPVEAFPELKVDDKYEYANYTWDKLCLFYVPDMTKPEFQKVVVHDADSSDGDKGIWLNINHNQNGDVFIDSKGRMHILYTTIRVNYNYYNGHEDSILSTKSYHAIYEGMECVYNEPIHYRVYSEKNYEELYTMRMAESSDGRFYIIAMHTNSRKSGSTVEIWKATDELYSQFELESTKTLGKKIVSSFSISSPRGFSVQDGVVDCLLSGDSNGRNAYYFTVKLE